MRAETLRSNHRVPHGDRCRFRELHDERIGDAVADGGVDFSLNGIAVAAGSVRAGCGDGGVLHEHVCAWDAVVVEDYQPGVTSCWLSCHFDGEVDGFDRGRRVGLVLWVELDEEGVHGVVCVFNDKACHHYCVGGGGAEASREVLCAGRSGGVDDEGVRVGGICGGRLQAMHEGIMPDLHLGKGTYHLPSFNKRRTFLLLGGRGLLLDR